MVHLRLLHLVAGVVATLLCSCADVSAVSAIFYPSYFASMGEITPVLGVDTTYWTDPTATGLLFARSADGTRIGLQFRMVSTPQGSSIQTAVITLSARTTGGAATVVFRPIASGNVLAYTEGAPSTTSVCYNELANNVHAVRTSAHKLRRMARSLSTAGRGGWRVRHGQRAWDPPNFSNPVLCRPVLCAVAGACTSCSPNTILPSSQTNYSSDTGGVRAAWNVDVTAAMAYLVARGDFVSGNNLAFCVTAISGTVDIPSFSPGPPPNLTMVFNSPTGAPTATPSAAPSTAAPTLRPTTAGPTAPPTRVPSAAPSTAGPTAAPSATPTVAPTGTPSSSSPTALPTASPSPTPSTNPTGAPSAVPSAQPTMTPSGQPSSAPSASPSSPGPTRTPSSTPTPQPSASPTALPSASPTPLPSPTPTDAPSTAQPTAFPSSRPSGAPSTAPTSGPSSPPTSGPTMPQPGTWNISVSLFPAGDLLLAGYSITVMGGTAYLPSTAVTLGVGPQTIDVQAVATGPTAWFAETQAPSWPTAGPLDIRFETQAGAAAWNESALDRALYYSPLPVALFVSNAKIVVTFATDAR
jgi:hypothetical protein